MASDLVTVTQPTLTIQNIVYYTTQVGSGLHRNFRLAFSDPVPVGGITVTLSSSDPTKVGVPASITVAAGDTFADFPVSGLALTTSPVTISAAAPGWLTGTYSVTVVTATFAFYYGVPTARTTLSAAHPIAVYTFTPGCGYNCDSANANITVQLTVAGTPSNIVAIAPASVTILQNASISDIAAVGTPTSAGSYTITASATGFTSLASDLVTVTQPTLTIQNIVYYTTQVRSEERRVGKECSSGWAPDRGNKETLESSDPTKVGVPASITVAAAG